MLLKVAYTTPAHFRQAQVGKMRHLPAGRQECDSILARRSFGVGGKRVWNK